MMECDTPRIKPQRAEERLSVAIHTKVCLRFDRPSFVERGGNYGRFFLGYKQHKVVVAIES